MDKFIPFHLKRLINLFISKDLNHSSDNLKMWDMLIKEIEITPE